MFGRLLVLMVASLIAGASVAACSLGLRDGCAGSESCAPDATTWDVADVATGDSGDSCLDAGTCGEDAAPEHVALDSTLVDSTGQDSQPDAVDAFVCDPTAVPHDQPCVLRDAYGVFVVPSSPLDAGLDASAEASVEAGSGDGTMQRPYRSIGEALAHRANRTRIYLCNGLYREQVAITSPVEVYGGLSCSSTDGGLAWSFVGGSAQVIAPTSDYALSVTGVGPRQDGGLEAGMADAGLLGSVTIEDVAFSSPSAATAGSSSIAAIAIMASLHLVRVTLSAGSGADGARGADGAINQNYLGAAPDGGPQVLDNSGFSISGGAGGVNTCMRFGNSAGGDGGTGCSLGAGFGTPGTSNPLAPITMAGRDGLPRGSPLPDGGAAASDDPGADGVTGDGGTPPQGYGVLSPSGWMPSAGGDGATGSPGQGGAGGSDPLANTNCSAPVVSVGGGGGGAGGCGGAGGKGGGGGGASIALAGIASTVDLQACVLSTGSGGTGGAGGAGQDGQPGGAGGDDSAATYAHAPGAVGGNGAGGSGGAGGTGGLSVGVLQQGSLVTYDPTRLSINIGSPGAGGAAGPAGRHPSGGTLPTGSDGNPGASGRSGTSMAVLFL